MLAAPNAAAAPAAGRGRSRPAAQAAAGGRGSKRKAAPAQQAGRESEAAGDAAPQAKRSRAAAGAAGGSKPRSKGRGQGKAAAADSEDDGWESGGCLEKETKGGGGDWGWLSQGLGCLQVLG